MSQKQTNLRKDIARLIEEGYEVYIAHNHLIMRGVPYVDSTGKIKFGTLVSTLSGSRTEVEKPDTHVVMFAGEYPCDKNGAPLEKIRNTTKQCAIDEDLTTNHQFSSKPKSGYIDYYDKMSTYAAIISSPAIAIDSNVTPCTFRVIETADDSTFEYFDNASARAGISAISAKLRAKSITIIGLGGTGSYVLDFVAKTPVEKIQLIDGDVFKQHNSFRAPGAASIDVLRSHPFKVDYLASIYGRMHKGIVTHSCYITQDNLELLQGQDMVFLCIDAKSIKASIIETLEEQGIPFIDVGMGVEVVNDGLTALLRTTTSTSGHRSHVHDKNRVPMTDTEGDNVYAQNIQISELNAMNACLAVIRWKKMCGFYRDLEGEFYSLYALESNQIINEDDQ